MTAKIRSVLLMFALSTNLGLPASAETATAMQLLKAEVRAAWQAVGRVNASGFRLVQGCSGTLIAPDLVVTAAHCVGSDVGLRPERHFVAGYFQGEYSAHRVSSEIVVHPLYGVSEGARKFVYDIAVIRLETPISSDVVAPVALKKPATDPEDNALLLGYQNTRPHALSGQHDCALRRQVSGELRVYGCIVAGGTSGGAVIEQGPEGPVLAAIIVAKGGAQGEAISVPVNIWLHRLWHQAMEREAARRDAQGKLDVYDPSKNRP